MEKPEGKRSIGRHRYRWEENIKIYLRLGCGSMDWIDLNKDMALVNAVMKVRFP